MLCQAENVEADIVEGFAVRKRVWFLLTDWLGKFGAKIICDHFIFARKSPAVITVAGEESRWVKASIR